MDPFILHIAIISLLDVTGIFTAKLWYIHKNPLFMVATVLLFAGAGYTFAKSLRYEGMAIANVLWVAISIIVVTCIGYFFFKEEIAPIQILGILIITIGLILINLN